MTPTFSALLRRVPVRTGYIIAVNLLLISVVLSQITGYYDRRDERARAVSQRQDLSAQIERLSAQVECRARVGSATVAATADLVAATGRGLVALTEDNQAELRVQAAKVTTASKALDQASADTAAAENDC